MRFTCQQQLNRVLEIHRIELGMGIVPLGHLLVGGKQASCVVNVSASIVRTPTAIGVDGEVIDGHGPQIVPMWPDVYSA